MNLTNELKSDMETALINAMQKYQVTITTGEIPEILKLGADTFLQKRGVDVPEKMMLEFYLIINEMRGSSPTKTSFKSQNMAKLR